MKHFLKMAVLYWHAASIVLPRQSTQISHDARRRYDAEAGLLINDERGVAYPLVDGIPRLIPSEEQPYPAKS